MVGHAGAGGVRPFLKLLEVQALRGAADRELLRRFAAGRDEAAFRVIAERHGPMVLGVCARLLGNRHDAEDALQATFLVFARRAAAVRKSESLASWLHGVARRVATRLRRADQRRNARERAAAQPDGRTPADELAWSEVRAGLDEELGRLPNAYREVLVLCYLEGLSRDEAGQRLGIDAGAVKGRLERGRRLLGERLVKRGIGLSAALAGLAVAPPATATVHLGRLAADPAAASPRAAALTHEFLKGVAMSKFKLITAGFAGALVLAAGVGMGTAQVSAPPVKQPSARPLGEKVTPAAADKDTDEAFIRRVSKDLRGTEPTPAELHFFLASKDANRRAKLVDLFVKELNDKKPERADKLVERAWEAEAEKRKLADLGGWKLLEMARAREQEARVLAERVRDEAERERALAEARAAEDKAQAVAEALAREAAKGKAAIKGFRDAADPTAKPAPQLPGPVFSSGSKAKAADPVPVMPVTPAPAANVEILRVRVQIAEVTLREKSLAARDLEAQVKGGVVNVRELDRAKLEVERAQLLVREAQLTLEAAERPVPALPLSR